VIPIGSTALITGASSGIGEQFARQLAARGVNLVLVARREERLEAIANDLAQAHPEMSSTVMVADLSSGEAPERLVRELEKSQITVDLLINDAGVGSLTRFVDEDLDAALRQIQLDCISPVSLTGHLLPTTVARGRGGVINVASSAAFQPIPTMAVYAASKAFVLSFSEALWAETRTSGVRVLALCPGPTETQIFATASKEKQFLTRGRQTPEQVATFALRAYESGCGPSAIPGLANRFLANGHRFFPRATMVQMAARNVRPV
jgi:short-subunit dehydrogenase